jgi:hypothetical protein
MISSHPDNERGRKEKTIKAHSILLKADERDFSGCVTFHFRKGQGIVGHETIEKSQWSISMNENKVLAFESSSII